MSSKKIIGILIIIMGVMSGFLFFEAGSSISQTGDDMKKLQSQSGTSLAEAYYQEVGELAKGISLFAYGLGLSVIAFSIGMGGKMVLEIDSKDATKEKDIDFNQLPKL